MSSEKWDAVAKIYRDVYLQTRYAAHARAMLDLIPQLQKHEAFAEVIPVSSHGTLVLTLPAHRETINILYEGNETYTVCFEDPEEGELEKMVVKSQLLIQTLEAYLETLRTKEKVR